MKRNFRSIPILLAIFLAANILFFGCKSKRPTNIGVSDGRLTDCPASPNCVCSMITEEDTEHFIPPLTYKGTRSKAHEKLIQTIQQTKRTEIIESREDYIHAEFKTKMRLFTDDVEFFLPESDSVIHMRSASRVGYSDMGANRTRMEKFRKDFNASGPND